MNLRASSCWKRKKRYIHLELDRTDNALSSLLVLKRGSDLSHLALWSLTPSGLQTLGKGGQASCRKSTTSHTNDAIHKILLILNPLIRSPFVVDIGQDVSSSFNFIIIFRLLPELLSYVEVQDRTR